MYKKKNHIFPVIRHIVISAFLHHIYITVGDFEVLHHAGMTCYSYGFPPSLK